MKIKVVKFILDNPRIKLWVHGHTHIPCDYKISECIAIYNPFGYIRETFMNIKNIKRL